MCLCVCVCVCVWERERERERESEREHSSTFKTSWLTSTKEHFALSVYVFFKSIKQDGSLAEIFMTFSLMRIINELLGSGMWNFRYGYCSSLYQHYTRNITCKSATTNMATIRKSEVSYLTTSRIHNNNNNKSKMYVTGPLALWVPLGTHCANNLHTQLNYGNKWREWLMWPHLAHTHHSYRRLNGFGTTETKI